MDEQGDDLLLPRRMRPERPRSRAHRAARATIAADASSERAIVPEGPFVGERAVVIGASVTGLLAARALSDHFERVVVIERDYLHDRPVGRKGVPQARHGHIFLAGGAAVVAELFPEIAAESEAAGLHPVDAGSGIRWFHFGVWKARSTTGVVFYLVNRMLFEHALRRQLSRRTNVEIVDDADVLGFEYAAAEGRIVGVRVQRRDGDAPEVFASELVVDASGRGSRTPRWLAELGFPKVEETEVKMAVAYASRVYRLPRDFALDRLPMAAFPRPPQTRRMGVMYTTGEGVLMVTLGGWCRDHPPAKDEGYLEFARTLPVPDFAEVLEECKPAPAVHPHQVPSSLRHRYERMGRWPEGLVVAGDALCSFNPIYGQGMSVGALEVAALAKALARLKGRREVFGRPGTARRLQRRMARQVTVPWLMAACEDLRYPEVVGRRPLGFGLLQWYVAQVLELSGSNEAVLRSFSRVMNLVAGPQILFAPAIVLAVIVHALRRRR